jgi:hypothetical protein
MLSNSEMAKLNKLLKSILPDDTKINVGGRIDIYERPESHLGNSITRDKEVITLFTVSRFGDSLLLERLPIQEKFYANGERSSRYQETPSITELLSSHADYTKIIAYIVFTHKVWEDYDGKINESKQAEILLP